MSIHPPIISLLLEVCPKITVWYTPEYTSLRLESRRVAVKALDLLEIIHPLLKKRFDEFQRREQLISQRIEQQRIYAESLRAEEREYYLSKKLEVKRLQEEAEAKRLTEEEQKSHDGKLDTGHERDDGDASEIKLKDHISELDTTHRSKKDGQNDDSHDTFAGLGVEKDLKMDLSDTYTQESLGNLLNEKVTYQVDSILDQQLAHEVTYPTSMEMDQRGEDDEERQVPTRRRSILSSSKFNRPDSSGRRVSFSPSVDVREYQVNPEEYPSSDTTDGEDGDTMYEEEEGDFEEEEDYEDYVGYDEDFVMEQEEDHQDDSMESNNGKVEQLHERKKTSTSGEIEEYDENSDTSQGDNPDETSFDGRINEEEPDSQTEFHEDDSHHDMFDNGEEEVSSSSGRLPIETSQAKSERIPSSNDHPHQNDFRPETGSVQSVSPDTTNRVYLSTAFLDPDKYE